MDTKTAGRDVAGEPYYYRRSLGSRDMLVSAGAAVGVAAVVFYVASLFQQRTPLVPDRLSLGDSDSRRPARRTREG